MNVRERDSKRDLKKTSTRAEADRVKERVQASHERETSSLTQSKVRERERVSVCSAVLRWPAWSSVSIWVPSVSLALAFATLELTYVGMQTHA